MSNLVFEIQSILLFECSLVLLVTQHASNLFQRNEFRFKDNVLHDLLSRGEWEEK